MRGARTASLIPVVASIATLGIVASCVDLDSLQNGPPRDGGTGEESVATDAGAPPDPCAHRAPVAKPSLDDEPSRELPELELAIAAVTLDPVTTPGFDLDGVCTCDSRPFAAADGGRTCVSPSNKGCDLDGGVDNATGVLAATFAISPAGSITNAPNALIARGERTLLIQLAKYNGRANDPSVRVNLYLAEGIRTAGCPTSTASSPGFFTPGGCGDDAWTLSPVTAGVTGGTGRPVPLVIGEGYVTDYQLVARMTNAVEIPFGSSITLSFSSTVVTGKLVPLGIDLKERDPSRPPTAAEGRLYRIKEGILAGRVEVGQLLGAIGSYNGLCNGGTWPSVRDIVCKGTDIQLAEKDPPNPMAACDALSIGLGFDAIPARAGEVLADAGLPPPPCTPDKLVCP